MKKAGPLDCCSHQLVAVAVALPVSRRTVDIMSTFCGGFMVQYAKLMLRIFEFGGFYCLTVFIVKI